MLYIILQNQLILEVKILIRLVKIIHIVDSILRYLNTNYFKYRKFDVSSA